jgi:hypothetical protein
VSESPGGKVRSGEFLPIGRAHAVLEVDASAQLVTDIEELLAFDAPFTWYTMSEEGPVLDWQHVRTIVDQVGSSFEKTFVTIWKSGQPDRFAQCCGHPATGLIVEISSPEGSALITRLHAKAWEGHLVTNLRWAYFAADDELHSPEATMEIFFEWLVHGRIPPGMERRPPWGMVGRR